jgi:pseudaminic acid synthase
MSCNHNQHKETAISIIEAAKAVGADAVKVQCYKPGSLVINDGQKIQSGPWEGMTYWELYEKSMMPWEWIPELMQISEDVGIDFIGTPFCNESLEYLKKCGVKHYKVASMEAYDRRFTEKVIEASLDMHGMCYISRNGKRAPLYGSVAGNIITLNCVSEYPATHYRKNDTMGLNWGISDHSTNNISAILATYEGACVIEKHMKISNVKVNGYGFDYSFSLTPSAFNDMINAVRNTEMILKTKDDYNPTKYARTVRAKKDIKKGDVFTYDNIGMYRPGGKRTGMDIENFINGMAKHDYNKGEEINGYE